MMEEGSPQKWDLSRQHAAVDAATALRALAAAAERRGYAFDAYGDGASLQAFEARVAQLCGKPEAIFAATGTAAQQAALFALASGAAPLPRSGWAGAARPLVLVHGSCHLVHLACLGDGAAQAAAFAASAARNMPEFEVARVGRARAVPAARDVAAALDARAAGQAATLVLELPQRMNGGATVPLDELRAISALCRRRGVRLHLDGARLWDVAPFYAEQAGVGVEAALAAVCGLFDTVYVSLYKGVGGLACAALAGPEAVVRDAKTWIARRGANVYTLGPQALAAEVALEAALPTLARRVARIRVMVSLVDAAAAEIGAEALVAFDPPTPQAAMVHCYLAGDRDELERHHDEAAAESGVRLWNRIRGAGHPSPDAAAPRVYFEWSVGPGNVDVPDASVRAGWLAFLRRRVAAAAPEARRRPKRPRV